jgi:uncharacterized protein (UPF0332 family)
MLAMKLCDAAGRTAYLAGFHAAQALISERLDKAVKTHRGVHMQLHLLVKDDPRVDAQLRGFLGIAYDLKSMADYETGPGSEVSLEAAEAAIATSKRFVAKMAELIENAADTAST